MTTLTSPPPQPPALEAYYEQGALWELDRYAADADQRRRAAKVAELVDPACASLLDVGCGSGFITAHLHRPGRRVVGLDPSREALARFQGECVCGSADAIGFADRSFDTVVCTEVLEHLAPAVLARAAGELARVAARQIIIGVPYREELAGGMTRCAECGRDYHVSLHQRSFAGPRDVARLFDGFAVTAAATVGRRQSPRWSWFLRLRQRLVGLDLASPFTRCPACGSPQTARPTGRPILRWLLDGLNWRLGTRSRPKWVLVSLSRIASNGPAPGRSDCKGA